jgi:hypothetical protein
MISTSKTFFYTAPKLNISMDGTVESSDGAVINDKV